MRPWEAITWEEVLSLPAPHAGQVGLVSSLTGDSFDLFLESPGQLNLILQRRWLAVPNLNPQQAQIGVSRVGDSGKD